MMHPARQRGIKLRGCGAAVSMGRRVCGNDLVMLKSACFTFHRVPHAQALGDEQTGGKGKTNIGKHSLLPNGLIYFTKTQNQKTKKRKNGNL